MDVNKLYNHYGSYLRSRFSGQRIYKIVVDGGFTCPNRDGSKGYGGCTYCNVDSFTPKTARKIPSIQEQITNGWERANGLYSPDGYLLYFQPNTNTYAPLSDIKALIEGALEKAPENTVGISVGTRADCLDIEKIEYFSKLSEKMYVSLEIGLESMYDETLSNINRGHSMADFEKCMKLLRPHCKGFGGNIELCVHTILGFPNETEDMLMAIPDYLNSLPIIFTKFHQLHIVKGAAMATHWKRKPFELFSIDEYAALLGKLIPKLRPDIVIQRLFAVTEASLLIAPNWDMGKSKTLGYLENYLNSINIRQGSEYTLI